MNSIRLGVRCIGVISGLHLTVNRQWKMTIFTPTGDWLKFMCTRVVIFGCTGVHSVHYVVVHYVYIYVDH